MAWLNPKNVQDLIHCFEAMKASGLQMPSGLRKPIGSRTSQTPVTPGSKRWSAQQRAGWNWPKSTCYDFGFRTVCFGCKICTRPAGLVPQDNKGGTGRKPVPSALSKPWENLEHQLASKKDPEVKALLQQAAALKKKQAAGAGIKYLS
eukprot:4368543-Amphidinium_carterae.1